MEFGHLLGQLVLRPLAGAEVAERDPDGALLLEAAVARYGGGADQAPDVETLVALDIEVRNAYAAGGV